MNHVTNLHLPISIRHVAVLWSRDHPIAASASVSRVLQTPTHAPSRRNVISSRDRGLVTRTRSPARACAILAHAVARDPSLATHPMPSRCRPGLVRARLLRARPSFRPHPPRPHPARPARCVVPFPPYLRVRAPLSSRHTPRASRPGPAAPAGVVPRSSGNRSRTSSAEGGHYTA